ncbi:cell division protein FtsI [peptidoglycan synthetase] /transpeptidase, penicillin binding protein transpeptidase domain [Mesobacillus selenatarsenatis SF-1]|uniref:serine-type D-Ala-D-Ala carboxypeptidase n=2 Tax=Mesobacillus selenatarsenatis TaxID=388741 RepID=A0A0A8X153_MESS1|nr:cell division protein FtsI [peptidoglycan synthetase] /transpeptidase, penicillin binding protein transpeptidase domain [Mesobacillus selenatarsenatis SF-1]
MNKKKKKKTHVPFRLNMLFFAVFVLFSMLILRLGIVQIVYGEDFKREIERTEDVTVNNPVPRGKMYDRNMKTIVDNTPSKAITYTKSQGTKTKEMLMVAERLAKLISKDSEEDLKKVRERDKKDYWILTNEERAREKILEKEWAQYDEKKLDDKALYNLQLDRITENELNELTDEDLEILAILREMMSGYALSPQIVKKEVTPEEFAIVSENLEMLPGVDTTTDWERKYSYDKTLRSILGKVSDSEKGLPKEKLEYYLARGYSRNDRVGLSYIEQQYEDVLHGQKAKVKNITDKGGNVLDTKVITDGQRGKDLVLTIDMDLQLAVEKIIEEELAKAKQQPRTGLLDRAFVVLMDPNTGEVLSLAGKQIVKDEETGKTVMQDFASGNFTTSYNVGSAVKGATILTGFNTGAISPGTQFYDTPIKIAGTNPKKSWKAGLGTLDDRNALKVSSNVYMFMTAINIGKGNYRYDKPLYLEPQAFNTMRNYFSQFGLGTRTGIDLPNEMVGFKGTETRPGLLLDFAIGQYDTYTTLQLAQYVSTIANGGNRLQPRIVKEIREPVMKNNEVGPVLNELEPVILNKVDGKPEWFDRVQEGFRRVMQERGGTAYGAFYTADYKPAGKTGTAQAFYDGPKRKNYDKPPEVMNLSLVAYAPYENPEIAMAVMVPWAYEGNQGHHANNDIGRRVLDTYFELKKKRLEGNMNPEQPIQEIEKKEEGTELLEEIAEDIEQ